MPSKGLRSERDNGVPVGTFQALTVGVVAGSLASIIPASMTTYAFVEVQAQPIRVRFDGTAPTGAVGHQYLPGQSEVWSEAEFRAAQVIRDANANGDATLAVTFYKS